MTRNFEFTYAGRTFIGGLRGQDLEEAFRLRAEVFCRELRWVGHGKQQKENDIFDSDAIHLGIKTNQKIQAYLRVHPTDTSWMCDSIFKNAVPLSCHLHQPGSCEVSRLAVAKPFRSGSQENSDLSTRILQLMFLACRIYSFETIYAIVSFRVFLILQKKGLPFRLETKVVKATKADTPLLVTLNWNDFLAKRATTDYSRRSFLAFEEHALSQVGRFRSAWDKAG